MQVYLTMITFPPAYQMAALNKSMTVLNKSTSLLNRSLSDVQEIKTRMASLKSIIDSYDSQFREVHRNLGDVEHQRKQLEDELDSLSSDVADVKVPACRPLREPVLDLRIWSSGNVLGSVVRWSGVRIPAAGNFFLLPFILFLPSSLIIHRDI